MQSLAKSVKGISQKESPSPKERGSHIIFKEKEKDTYPFYYYYTEVWKDWFLKK